MENQQKMLQEIRQNFKKQRDEIENLKNYIDTELNRREDWQKRACDTLRNAQGKPVWIIKCPAPDGEAKEKWGDYPYAVALKKYLERLNLYVEIDLKNDWNREVDADVVLVLRGYYFYRPDRRNTKCKYIMWNISHPEMVSTEEYNLYDVVCIASEYYAEKLKDQVKVPVIPLLQCTDTEIFCPQGERVEDCKDSYLFIGNSRNVARNCVMWSVEKEMPLYLVGSNWNKILKERMDVVKKAFVVNEEVPKFYRSAKVTLNDHWQDMLENRYINNRIFDALACGLPVITDYCDELQRLFSEGLLYYSNRREFDECVRQIEENYEEVKAKAEAQREMICEKFSFEARAKRLVEIANGEGL